MVYARTHAQKMVVAWLRAGFPFLGHLDTVSKKFRARVWPPDMFGAIKRPPDSVCICGLRVFLCVRVSLSVSVIVIVPHPQTHTLQKKTHWPVSTERKGNTLVATMSRDHIPAENL